MSSLSKLGTAAAVVKRQTSVVKTNQMTYCSFCGARGVSASQNKRGVKISTLETKKLRAKAYTSNLGWHVKTAASLSLTTNTNEFLVHSKHNPVTTENPI